MHFLVAFAPKIHVQLEFLLVSKTDLASASRAVWSPNSGPWMTLLHWDPRVQVLHWHENDRVHCYHNEFSDLTHLCMAVPLSKGKNSGRLAVSLYEKKGHPNYPNLRWLNLYGSVRGGSLERTRKFMPGVEVVSEQCCLRLWDWV